MTERFIVDDCGTLVNMQTRETYDYVSDICPVLNELNEENEELKKYFDIPIDSNGKSMSIKELLENYEQLKEENQSLKDDASLFITTIEKENEKLKEENKRLKLQVNDYSDLNDECIRSLEEFEMKLKKLQEENEQLKKQLKKKEVEPIVKALKERDIPYRYYTDNKAGKEVRELFKSKPLNCTDHWDGEH